MGGLARTSASEKSEIIRLVEGSGLPVKQTLAEIGVPRSTFYRWYEQYQRAGMAGPEDQSSQPRQFWNRIPDAVRDQVVQIALANLCLRRDRTTPLAALRVVSALLSSGARARVVGR